MFGVCNMQPYFLACVPCFPPHCTDHRQCEGRTQSDVSSIGFVYGLMAWKKIACYLSVPVPKKMKTGTNYFASKIDRNIFSWGTDFIERDDWNILRTKKSR